MAKDDMSTYSMMMMIAIYCTVLYCAGWEHKQVGKKTTKVNSDYLAHMPHEITRFIFLCDLYTTRLK